MSLLYLHFATPERDGRVQKLQKSGVHVLVSEPRWPGFFELAKKEKPYAIGIDFSQAPSHALETADYLAKARETRDAEIFLLQVPPDRLEVVGKRLPNARIVTEQELAERVAAIEREAEQRAREKKEAAALARKTARARAAAEKSAPAGTAKPPARPTKPPVKKKKPAPRRGKSAPARARAKPKTHRKKARKR